MKTASKEILLSSLALKDYLEAYGIDRHNTKRDILLLEYLNNIAFNRFLNLKEQDIVVIFKYIDSIKNTNPQIVRSIVTEGKYIINEQEN